jgi:hypothetical protein
VELLRVPYLLNILILLPVAPLTLLGGRRGCTLVFQGRLADSPGIRTLLGSLWTAILIGSALGVAKPMAMWPILVLQVVYKSLWLLIYVLPCLVKGRSRDVPIGVSVSFVLIVLTYPWFIPWHQMFIPEH